MRLSPKRVFDQSGQFIGSPVNGVVQGGGLIGDGDGLTTFEADFNQAAQAIIAVLLFAVLIAQVDIDGGDAIAKFAQRIFHNALALIRQALVTCDVVIRADLDLHGGFLL